MAAHSKKDAGSSNRFSLLLAGKAVVVSALLLAGVESFSPTSTATRRTAISTSPTSKKTITDVRRRFVPSSFFTMQRGRPGAATTITTTPASSDTALSAKSSSSGGGKKRRRRKRKKPPQENDQTPVRRDATTAATTAAAQTTSPPPPPPAAAAAAVGSAPAAITTTTISEEEIPTFEGEEINVDDIKSVAEFAASAPSIPGMETPPPSNFPPSSDVLQPREDGSIPLPDIKDTLRRKKMEIANKGSAGVGDPTNQNNMPKTKIDRNDRQALLKLLEQDPYADGDDSFFEEQEYTSVSAWLGEGTKPFLGIPTGPLQVGHTIGALVIVLMAFIEYPGFPLTNLPTPLRDALQGGLGTVYGINVLLSIVAIFKANARDQPVKLWVAKTLTVGGLALDQLTQLPTKEQIEAAKARKGKRAPKNKKRK